jgi:hypothetical protein
MPLLDLTELELKIMWLLVDRHDGGPDDNHTWRDTAMNDAEQTLFCKVYRAYRGIPEAA